MIDLKADLVVRLFVESKSDAFSFGRDVVHRLIFLGTMSKFRAVGGVWVFFCFSHLQMLALTGQICALMPNRLLSCQVARFALFCLPMFSLWFTRVSLQSL